MEGVRVIGIDPGTVSFDVCGLEGGQLFLDRSIPSENIAANPEILVKLLESAGPVDLIVGPSGYGLPWVKASDLTDEQMRLLTLSDKRDQGKKAIIGGMNRMICLLKDSGLPIVFAPGLIHLPTIPPHRKVNKIDMGTADKLCALALGIWDQARHLKIGFEETSFIYVELGGAFTGVMAVNKGKVVDGMGGTSGCLGYQSMGSMDGEVAYLLGGFNKQILCTGGVSHIAGEPGMQPDELLAKRDQRSIMGWDALMEGIVKCVAAEMSIVPNPREILISGRLCRQNLIVKRLEESLSSLAPLRRVEGFARVAKEAAQGAALLAKGLAAGEPKGLVETMEVRRAGGTALDHLYFQGAKRFRKKQVGF